MKEEEGMVLMGYERKTSIDASPDYQHVFE